MARFGLMLVTVMLSGCSTLGDKMMCFGTGACGDLPVSSTATPAGSALTMPQHLQLGSKSYILVPNYSTGNLTAIIQTAK